MNITVVGMGYVGLSNAVLLAQHHTVIALDIDAQKISQINQKIMPFSDPYMGDFLKNTPLQLHATQDKLLAFKNADYIIIATPTDYDSEKGYFNTASIEMVLDGIKPINSSATIVIRSTIPIGYIQQIRERFPHQTIFFVPEFLREGQGLYDNLYPSRIIIGAQCERAKTFAHILQQCAIKKEIPILFTGPNEAEAIKLFANTFLAMRVAYFNELDTYAMSNQLNTQQIINGIGTDPRIGMYYNNPSFGYGGYCLPKDTKQLLANYQHTPQDLIQAIVKSNETRMNFIVNDIIGLQPRVVGIYRLIAKAGSDNFREASMWGIIKRLKNKGVRLIIYEPLLHTSELSELSLIHNLKTFKEEADLIVANRIDSELTDVLIKVYTRDLFETL